MKKEFSVEFGGKTLAAEFNDWAENADGSVLLKYGATAVLVTAVMSKNTAEGDFFPLTVDYEEKFYATGQILGSRYTRREGRPSDEAILSGRIADRAMRPLFDQWIRNEVQVVITVLSLDEDDPDILGVIGSSLALGVSRIPWNGPVSAVRIAKHRQNGFQINPTFVERENETYELDLVACGKDGSVNMIELAGDEAQEADAVEALKLASAETEKIGAWQKKIIAEIGRPKEKIEKPETPEAVKKIFEEAIAPSFEKNVMAGAPGHEGLGAVEAAWSAAVAHLPEKDRALAARFLEEKIDALVHREVLENEKRADGRKLDELRPLSAEAGGLSKILHGSGLFYRGGTHILSVLTLGGPKDALYAEGLEDRGEPKRFIHHYNFPPFSTGETGRIGSINRRMIGHGALAEKALLPVIPPQSVFPYTIRIVSEALSANGSTSMGSVCASTLALMDGGVPIKKPVAGIASGLMMNEKGEYKILTDIAGPEDHYGDMDFKVAGTKDGITAIQMDVKVSGVPIPILAEAFERAKKARLEILGVLEKAIAAPRADISENAPKILTLKVPEDRIGGIIGPGGKTVKKISQESGADIDIGDDGIAYFTGKNGSAERAKKSVEELLRG